MNASVKSPAKATKKNVPTTKTIFVEVPKEAKKEVRKGKKVNVVYLNEGVTGKDAMKSIYSANNKHKSHIGTFSYCLRAALLFNEFEGVIKGFNVDEVSNPKVLIPLRSEHNKGKEKFSVYEVLMLIKKFYQAK
jgi:hypothetical protein